MATAGALVQVTRHHDRGTAWGGDSPSGKVTVISWPGAGIRIRLCFMDLTRSLTHPGYPWWGGGSEQGFEGVGGVLKTFAPGTVRFSLGFGWFLS